MEKEKWVRIAELETTWNHYEISNLRNVRTIRKATGEVKLRKLSTNAKNMPMIKCAGKTYYVHKLLETINFEER